MKNVDAFVKRIETVTGRHYHQCKAVVNLAISDSKGNMKDLTVEYPMQDDLHLTALMVDKETGRRISHDIMMPLVKIIGETLCP